jgi:hypothetical protein
MCGKDLSWRIRCDGEGGEIAILFGNFCLNVLFARRDCAVLGTRNEDSVGELKFCKRKGTPHTGFRFSSPLNQGNTGEK